MAESNIDTEIIEYRKEAESRYIQTGLHKIDTKTGDVIWGKTTPEIFNKRFIANFLETKTAIAAKLASSKNITFAKEHVSGVDDNANANANIQDAAKGKKVERSDYDNAPGGYVELDIKLLKGLLELSEKYKIGVSELAGGSHSKKSSHYEGNTVDINNINDKGVSIGHSDLKQFIEDAKKAGGTVIIGPPSKGHGTHLHIKF